MFVVKKEKYTNKTVYMPNELIEQLEKIMKEKDISFNRLVVQCCEYALANIKNDNSEPEQNLQE